VFSAETAFSSFAADGKVNQAYMDAGALFVPRVAFALSFFFSRDGIFQSPPMERTFRPTRMLVRFFVPRVALAPMLVFFRGQKAWEA
jgi:hypothetical protein